MRTSSAYGIDLAGYTTGRTVCAEAATKDGKTASVRIIHGCEFSKRQSSDCGLASIVAREVEFLKQMMNRGAVAVDVPIALQGLSDRINASKIWQLTLRPVDRVFGGLPALADRIGAPTARFRNIVEVGALQPKLGSELFETYPAGSLKMLGLPHKRYKGPGSEPKEIRREIQEGLNIDAEVLDDDDLDAAICAITALAQPFARLEADDLAECLSHRLPDLNVRPPEGYVLLKQTPFPKVEVTCLPVSTWLKEDVERD